MRLLLIILTVVLIITVIVFGFALKKSSRLPSMRMSGPSIPSRRIIRLLIWSVVFTVFVRWAWPALFQLGWTGKVKADAGRDAVATWAEKTRGPQPPPPPKQTSISSRTILVEVPVGELRTYKTRDYLEGEQFRVGWPDVEQGKLAAFEDGNDVATCTDFPGNPTTCYVDFEDSITFKNIGKEALRFYLTFTRLR